ncbi:phage tail sheath C-terminal domain-containing protein [Phaeobacter marinintestinus]|uniref:phage tail sheath C-terminal domain-containing protein n=1 Tax=Falsiphaeobacter marinintestinus TaxID=1492905 RepID=UPI0011B54DC1|nr:phage tail sheath C-terminal domain-containing protein [Phaeobacter marinintestinus]
MAVALSYPGVYIQEVPSGSRAIAGVSTSIAAFVGYTARGPVNDPVQLFSYADFERQFGGLHLDSPLSYAVNHFFLNGGATTWVVRVASGAAPAEIAMQTTGGALTLTAIAASEGTWANALVLTVDYDTANPNESFNLSVTEFVERGGRMVPARTEAHRNLSMSPNAATYAPTIIEADSNLITVRDENVLGAIQGESRSGPLTDAVAGDLDDDARRLAVSIDGGPFYEFDLFAQGGGLADLDAIRNAIDTIVPALEPANPAFSGFACTIDSGSLVATSGSTSRDSSVRFRRASIRSATALLKLGLAFGGREIHGSSPTRPAASGTLGERIDDFAAVVFADPEQMTVTLVDSAGATVDTETVTLNRTAAPVVDAPTSLAGARSLIETALRGASHEAISSASVGTVDGALSLRAGGPDASLRLQLSGAGATSLLLDAGSGAAENVAGYQMGIGPTVAFQQGAVGGDDGTVPSDTEIQGSLAQKSGLYALEDVRDLNIINLPEVYDAGVLANAITYAEDRRAMILIDIDDSDNDFEKARAWINDPANSGLRHKNAVVYFPRVSMPDPLQGNRPRSFANSGLMAGLYARTDASRGVWKAPAGIEARLRGVTSLDYVLSDPENGVLNPLGLNCLRTFPVFGSVSWGARTMVGADALASEWKYVPVRRLALFIEESLYRGTQFVVFEPNDEPLWAQIRLSVGSFMNNLFRQGAFQGATPQEAYLVRCDSSTTTQADIDLGIVNIVVGFAPLKPAEFVVIQIQQLAGQSQN